MNIQIFTSLARKLSTALALLAAVTSSADAAAIIVNAGQAVPILPSDGDTIQITGTGNITMGAGGDAIILTTNPAGPVGVRVTIDEPTVGGGGAITTNAAASGIGINLGSGTVSNSGSITTNGASLSSGIAIVNVIGGTVTNQATGTITTNGTGGAGQNDGIRVGSGNVTNLGSITTAGSTSHGINLTAAGSSTINNSGNIQVNGASSNGINVNGGDIVTNSGTINAAGAASFAGIQTTGSNNQITNSGTIQVNGFVGGIFSGGGDTIVNSGIINMTSGFGLGGIVLGVGDTLTNTGTINITGGPISGIFSTGGASTITNTGTISTTASGNAISSNAGDTVINTETGRISTVGATAINDTGASTSILNQGTITVTGGGIAVHGISAIGTSVTNTGTITNAGPGAGITTASAGTTITNSGSITSGGNAIRLGAAASTVNLSDTSSVVGARGIISNFGGHTININKGILRASAAGANVIQTGAGADTISIQGRTNIAGAITDNTAADGDVINLSNMKGVSKETIQALQSGNTAGTVRLYGNTISWAGIETINLDANTVIAYESLFTSPQLKNFGIALDNLNSFPDQDLLLFFNAFDQVATGDIETISRNLTGMDTAQGMSFIAFSSATQFTNTFMRSLPAFTASNATLGASGFTLNDASLDPLLASTNQLLAYSSPGLTVSDTASIGLATTATATSRGRLKLSELYPQLERSTVPEKRFITDVIGSGTSATQDATTDRSESNFFVTSATLRGGYRLNKDATVGAYAGYNGGEAETNTFGSELEYQGGHTGFFAQYRYQGLRASAIAGYTYTNYDSNRKIALPGLSRDAQAETDSHQVLVATEIAYDFMLGHDRQWRITPIIGLQYTHLWIDGYSETGANVLNLNVRDQSADSLQTKIGLEASKLWRYGNNGHVTFFANGFWHHEILDDSRNVTASFNSNAVSAFSVQTENPERDFAILGIGLDSVPFSNQDVHLLLGYQHQLGQAGYTSHTIYGGYRRDF